MSDEIRSLLASPEGRARVGREMAMAVFDRMREIRVFNRLRLRFGLPALDHDEAWAEIERLNADRKDERSKV